MPSVQDGPCSPLFQPISFPGTERLPSLTYEHLSQPMKDALPWAPEGSCVSWGIPFQIGKVTVVAEKPVTVRISPTKAPWFIFLHTSDSRPTEFNKHGLVSPMRGTGRLAELAANYVVLYANATEERIAIRRRHHVGLFQKPWGEDSLECVAHAKPHPVHPHHEQTNPSWGMSQTRVNPADSGMWINYLWAWQNPRPGATVIGFRFEPVAGTLIVSGVTAGKVKEMPLRWQSRRKAIVKIPKGEFFDPALDHNGNLKQIQLDMGQVISATPRAVYPNETWARTYNNRVPEMSASELIVEYTAHPEATFRLFGKPAVPVAKLEKPSGSADIKPIAPASRRVRIRVIEKKSGKLVPAKLHVHGEAGEYLAPTDRHRTPNVAWFEDYSVDFSNHFIHHCTYIPGETTIDLPLGRVFIEISKGFEIRPVRKMVRVARATKEIVIELEKVLPWRENGWVSADTHVHFLSPQSALLEGSGEGVNVVNLLASQWGELMTNVGDFDGKTTCGSRETGGDGEHLVRVGTENRQHVLGHISLLGYNGNIIAPMTTGGADESAIGDPVGSLLTEWAAQCRKQGGVSVLPHFPFPRLEGAAAIVAGNIDAVEMASWGDLYHGIDPYSLSDWYRYLNCGYCVAAVGGTDKMQSSTAVGALRTYAFTGNDHPFTYDNWLKAIRRGNTFVTNGPLLEFSVEDRHPGARIPMSRKGGTVDVTWKVASVTVPTTRVELVINGEIRASKAVGHHGGEDTWSVRVGKSCWMALIVRGHYPDKPEIITTHSSPVMIDVANSPFIAAADAVTILDQIEGALAYIDTIGTRAETQAYKRMRMVLVGAHRSLHNRMHEMGSYHEHSVTNHHKGHK